MARVTGFTAERMQTIEDTCIVGGAVLLDDLILTQRDGTTIDAGNVRGPKGDQGVQGLSASITSATAAGLAAGAAPTITLGGTPLARTFAFGIPKGDKGDQGIQGIQGIQGVDGLPGSAATPAGTITLWASDVAPTNWLICDGSAVSRTTYASLFATIGTKYGAGDGVNTFNLPNLKGQTPVGKDTTQTEFAALNQKGGEKKHLLVVSEMPSHTHLQNAHNHTQDAHTHGRITDENGQELILIDDQGGDATNANRSRVVVGSNARHMSTPSVTATNQAATATNQNTGGDVAHNVLQPYTVVNFIIKFTNGDSPNDSQLTQRVSTVESWMGQTPAGTVTIWGGDTAPTNWLLCDGSAVSRTTYASLFAVIGTKYGAGDGSTTFNLPNFKGRTPTGLDTTQTEFNALGKTGGEKTHILTTAEMPAHNHSVTDPQHTHGQNVSANPNTGGSGIRVDYNADGAGSNAYSQGINTGGGATNISIQNTGGGAAHNVLSPYLTVNYIIKFTNGDTQGDSQLTGRVSALETGNMVSARIDRKIARLQSAMIGGGLSGASTKITDGTFSWASPFYMVTGRDDLCPSGFFAIDMPQNGTVIPVIGHSTVTSITVANGVIDVRSISGYCSLYYDVPLGQPSASQPGRFLLVDYLAGPITVPQTCVLVMARSVAGLTPQWKWGTGRQQDFWHTMSLNSGYTNYSAGYAPAGYKINGDGDVLLRGLIVGGAGNVTTFPAGYWPEYAAIFTGIAGAGAVRLDVTAAGVLTIGSFYGGGGGGFISLEGIRWTPA